MSSNTQTPAPKSFARTVGTAMAAAFGILRQFPVLLPLGLITLFAQMTYSGINNVSLPKYIEGLQLSNEGKIIGTLTMTFLLAETFLRIPFGWLSDRFGRARMIVGAMLCTVPSLVLGALVPSYGFLYPLRAWDGMMAAALWPSVFALIGDAIPERFRANAMGVINMMYLLALFAGFALATGVVTIFPAAPRLYYIAGAIAIGTGGLVALAFFKTRPQFAMPHPEVHIEDAECAVVSVSRHVALLTITFIQNFSITLLAPFMILYVTTDLGFELKHLMVAAGVPIIGIALLALPLSRLSDTIGKVTAVRIAFTAIAIALWFFTFQRSVLGFTVCVTVIGVAFSMGIPAWLAILSSLSGSKTRGVTLAGYGTVQGLASVIGPLVGGFIWDHYNRTFVYHEIFGMPVQIVDSLKHSHLIMATAISVSIAALLCWVTLRESSTRSNNCP